MSDQQAQELTPAEREIVRGLKAWEFGCSDEETEGFYTGAKAALIAARSVQVERPDPLSTRIGTEGPLRRLPEQPDEGITEAARKIVEGRVAQVLGGYVTRTHPGRDCIQTGHIYREWWEEAQADLAALRAALAARPAVSEENPD